MEGVNPKIKYIVWLAIITFLYIGMLVRYNQLAKLTPGAEIGYYMMDAAGTIFYIAAVAATFYFMSKESPKPEAAQGANTQ